MTVIAAANPPGLLRGGAAGLRAGLGSSLFLLISLVGCAGPAPAAKFVEQADRLHNQALISAVTPDTDLQEYVQEIGHRIVAAARAAAPQKAGNPVFSQVKFHLVNNPTVNVFTTGGTHIYIYNGLFQQCGSEEELAAAISHGFAHALNLDMEKTGLRPDEERPLPAAAYGYVINRFTLPQEREADHLGFTLYAHGGWDPAKFEVLFRRMSDRFPSPAAPDRIPLDSRGDEARTEAENLSRSWRRTPVADRRTFLALRAKARSMQDSTNAAAPAQLYLRAFPNCILSADQPEQLQAQAQLRPPPPPAVRLEPN